MAPASKAPSQSSYGDGSAGISAGTLDDPVEEQHQDDHSAAPPIHDDQSQAEQQPTGVSPSYAASASFSDITRPSAPDYIPLSMISTPPTTSARAPEASQETVPSTGAAF